VKERPEESRDRERIELESAGWVVRRDRGFTAAEQDEFSQWLAADSRHGAALGRHRRNWERLDFLVQWRPEHAARPNRDLLAPRFLRGWPERHPWLVALPLAAAAAVAVGLFMAHRSPAVAAPVAGTAPNLVAAIEQRSLEDGSVVELNRGAEFAVLYTKAERHVRLERGEAHFTVAKNPDRPFIVSVAGVDVRAVGTQFDVRLNGTEVDVLVTEGRVKVGPIPLVKAGEEAVISLAPGAAPPRVVAVASAEMDRVLSWRPQLLDFTGAPLSEIVAAFNRHNAAELIIADPALANTRISVANLRSDDLEGFVRQLERGFDIRAERSGNYIILHKSP
jgi:transmembrane sensor